MPILKIFVWLQNRPLEIYIRMNALKCEPALPAAAAAAESLQSCPTLCYPIDGSPSGFTIPGILQARTLEWVAISFSNAWKWKVKVKSLSCIGPSVTPWTAAFQAPPSMGFSRQEYWSGVPLPSPQPSLADSKWQKKTVTLCWCSFYFLGLGKTITPKLNPSSNFVICVPHQDLFFSHFVLTNKGLSLNDAKKFLQQDFYLKVILLQRYISGAMLILPRQFTVVFTEKSPSEENMKIYQCFNNDYRSSYCLNLFLPIHDGGFSL